MTHLLNAPTMPAVDADQPAQHVTIASPVEAAPVPAAPQVAPPERMFEFERPSFLGEHASFLGCPDCD